LFSSAGSAVSTNTAATADSGGETVGVAKIRKSSAALREQIAKAKAAKRAASLQLQEPPREEEAHEDPAAAEEEEEASVPAVAPEQPFANQWSYDITTPDPFNQTRSGMAKSKILQQRAGAARSSGRLNIAAMGLKEIPTEVMNMYDFELVGAAGANWAESVDLTRFVAADNELEKIDDSVFPDKEAAELADEDDRGNIFGGLETIDLHGNMLLSVPIGFRQLTLLTALNLSQNRLQNETFSVIAQITSLRDLKLANNLFYGPLPPSFADLENLEILDLHGNNVSALPSTLEKLSRLRILNLSDNSFESLPFIKLAELPLTELSARNNKLSGTLIEDALLSFPSLQTLDISSNKVVRLVTPRLTIGFPSLHQLVLSMNRLQELPDVGSWVSLLTLTADENSIANFPEGFTCLPKIRHVDFSSNDIRIIPPEIARMDSLAMLRLSGNPLRDKKFSSITTEELKDALAIRLEPPPPYQERSADVVAAAEVADSQKIVALDAKEVTIEALETVRPPMDQQHDDGENSDQDDFATPPTSAPHSPARSRAHTLTSQAGRSRSSTLSNQVWPIKPGGVLDRSHTESSSLHPVVCSRIAQEHTVREVHLHHNLIATMPESLTFFADTLTALSLAHNQLLGETYLTQTLELPALRELNLVSNHVTSLVPLTTHLQAPDLEKLDVSHNRVASLPATLKTAFPRLAVLLASNNHLMELDPDTIRGVRVVAVSNNDIAHLNPRLGLLGGVGGLERLEVAGNRFRVPRWSVLERGTDATLRWLRGRVPVAEIAAWREANREVNGDDISDVD
jgi:Leucine-rich repeat (LRR) protein